jgi:alpha-beta hydrolase superfamily lysophospholipase
VPEADITKIKRKRKQQNWLLNWIVTAHGTQQGLALLAVLRQPKPSTAPAISPLATINF